MPTVRLGQIAYARSGDKGAGANVGVIARTPAAYEFLCRTLTAERVEAFFARADPGRVVRYELPNLLALNFVLPTILDGGGSVSLRIDAQGKALGQGILEMMLDVPTIVSASASGSALRRGRVVRAVPPSRLENRPAVAAAFIDFQHTPPIDPRRI